MFLRDKPNLLSEIRRATHYGVTPEKQEVDDLRSEVGSLRLQVTDMDGRIEALSRMVDRLLEERSAGSGEASSVVSAGSGDGAIMKHEIPSPACWAKKRRIGGEWDGASEGNGPEGAGVVRMQAGPPSCVKMEAGQTNGASEEDPSRSRSVQVKPELSDNPVYEFAGAMAEGGTSTASGDGPGMIIGGGPLCRDSSFLRELDNMSIGSEVGGGGGGGGGSLGPLQLIDVTGEEEGASADVMTESFFDLDFEAEITAMSGTVPGLDSQPQELLGSERNSVATIDSDASLPAAAASSYSSAPATPTETASATGGTALHDQEARIEELTASLDSMPAESRRKLAEGLLAVAQNPAVVSTFANGGATSPVVATAAPAATAQNDAAVTPATVSVAAPETPEIALPLASAALGAFMVHYAQAQAVKEPASAVAAVAMDATRHAIKHTTSLR